MVLLVCCYQVFEVRFLLSAVKGLAIEERFFPFVPLCGFAWVGGGEETAGHEVSCGGGMGEAENQSRYGTAGVEFEGKHKEETCVMELFFLPGQGRLISQCDNVSLHLFELNEKDGKWVLEEVKSCSLQGRLKNITTCCLPSSGEHLLIGTDGGNIYLLDVKSFEMTDHIIYQDIVIQKANVYLIIINFLSVPDDYKLNPGSVEAIAEHPLNPDKIVIGYNRGLMVLWDNKTLNSENTYVGSQQLESVSWHRSGTKFMSSHNDGTYVVWSSTDSSKPEEAPVPPYGPFPCKAISKVLWRSVKGGDDFTIFAGGMPRASYADKHTVTVMCGDKHQVLDFTSKVVDFFTICHGDEESVKYDNPHTLVVLAEEEIVLIDLESDDWLPFRLPLLSSLHMSSITCTQHVSNVPQDLWNTIITSGNKQVSGKYTEREWPITGGDNELESPTFHNLLLTGHEDGSVRFWDASGVALSHLYTIHTSHIFVNEDGEPPVDEEEWPPFRKVGSFDPYSDDPRLAIKKILLCPLSKTLVVAGTAGQIMFFELKDEEVEKQLEAHSVNIVSDRDSFVWKGHDQLSLKQGNMKFAPGFVPVTIEQLTPPAAVTAIALHTEWGLVAAGTAHGFALFDYIQKKTVMSKCTLNPNDLMAVGDAAMSRKKSFKKSLRQSFRRLRKGRSQRSKRDKTPTKEDVKSPAREKERERETEADTGAASPAVETKPVERQVEARSADDSMGSMVRCLYLAQSFIINNALQSYTLWAGTNAGAIYVFTISLPKEKDNRKTEAVACQLGKEIQLKHRAPVIAIQILDGLGHPLPEPFEVENNRAKSPDLSGNHRVIICSEEQFKVFTLPSLKPFCKFKLTASEGARVRKVAMIKFVSSRDENYNEDCMTCLTNQGEISIFTVPDLRRQQTHNCLKREDINGISSVVFTKTGQAFYLHSPCEFQRFTLSTKDILQTKCKIELPEGARPPPPISDTEESTEQTEEGEEKSADKEDQPEKAVDVVATLVENLNVKDEKAESTESKPDANASQDESKGELDITVDSVKDHISNLCTEGVTSVIEKAESSKVVQETVTKVSSMVVSTKETIINAKESVISTSENAKETVINATENAKESFLNASENAKGIFTSAKSSAKETVISTTEKLRSDNGCVVKGELISGGQVGEQMLNGISLTALGKSPKSAATKNKAPTAILEEFNHDEDGA
ncbi:lethal(2) giant larvae protein homolog 1 [Caerostris extrusa]|uniref:Lethal(2) giant larvae protein homolog 1 n=1 Tax=Caerostris extrusa TaxID=172846 RepID=A0AAV4MRL6_CAEEX|nr:lethal(2) giant larvae protein homolog 1 [Caerostris extrusa]